MKPEDMVTLSFYKELSSFKDDGSVVLVQHVDTNKLYVKKQVAVQNMSLYQTLQQLNVPGIPAIQHIIEADDKHIIIIENFINGETLENQISSGKIWSGEEAADIILQLCQPLKKMHSAVPPVIHRDIKPSNIIITGDRNATLIDFDASKFYDSEKNQDTVLMGTVDYAAPEQFGFKQSDARTDIYALGILFNKLLTGFLPKDLLHRGGFSKIIVKCTNMDPQERFASVELLEKAIMKQLEREKSASSANPKANTDPVSRSWLPPGFRTRKSWKMVVAILGYVLLFWVAAIYTFEEMSLVQNLMNQIALACWGLTVIALFTNYRNLAGFLPISSHSNPIIKYAGCLLWSVVTMIFALLLPDTIYGIFA